MNRMFLYARIALGIVGMLGVIFGSVWIAALAIFASAVFFHAYEAIIIGLLMDLVWLPPITLHTPPLFTLGAIVLVLAIEPLRREILS